MYLRPWRFATTALPGKRGDLSAVRTATRTPEQSHGRPAASVWPPRGRTRCTQDADRPLLPIGGPLRVNQHRVAIAAQHQNQGSLSLACRVNARTRYFRVPHVGGRNFGRCRIFASRQTQCPTWRQPLRQALVSDRARYEFACPIRPIQGAGWLTAAAQPFGTGSSSAGTSVEQTDW